MAYITASKLYDYTQCPHKVWRDTWGPQEEKIEEINPFVQLLWDRGVSHEAEVVSTLGEYLDLSKHNLEERFNKTIEAIKKKAPLIYQGVLRFDNLLGIPDLIKRLPDGSYMPIEIKSGMGFEGSSAEEDSEDEGKPKKHYAVQLCLYVELLEKLGFKHKNVGSIIDIHKNEVPYDLNRPLNARDKTTLWEYYKQVKNNVDLLLKNEVQNKPSYSGQCKLCPWYDSCKKWVKQNDDLTGLFYVGRSKRDVINEDMSVYKITEILNIDLGDILNKKEKDKNFLKGVGKDTLDKIKRRAEVLIKIKKPVAYQKLEFPKVSHELFFDIEDDPTREFVYLHGIYERNKKGEKFINFTAKENTADAEKMAWKKFWDYINTLPGDDFSVYYYSHHEKSVYRRLQKQYPDIISSEKVEDFFGNKNVIDLYKIVQKYTDWPLASYSIKDIATYLGFNWRDKTPSGALSIEWFNRYLETGDEQILKRLLEYNEDDCKATMVLKDALEKLDTN